MPDEVPERVTQGRTAEQAPGRLRATPGCMSILTRRVIMAFLKRAHCGKCVGWRCTARGTRHATGAARPLVMKNTNIPTLMRCSKQKAQQRAAQGTTPRQHEPGSAQQPEGCAFRQGQRSGGRHDVPAPPSTAEYLHNCSRGCQQGCSSWDETR